MVFTKEHLENYLVNLGVTDLTLKVLLTICTKTNRKLSQASLITLLEDIKLVRVMKIISTGQNRWLSSKCAAQAQGSKFKSWETTLKMCICPYTLLILVSWEEVETGRLLELVGHEPSLVKDFCLKHKMESYRMINVFLCSLCVCVC